MSHTCLPCNSKAICTFVYHGDGIVDILQPLSFSLRVPPMSGGLRWPMLPDEFPRCWLLFWLLFIIGVIIEYIVRQCLCFSPKCSHSFIRILIVSLLRIWLCPMLHLYCYLAERKIWSHLLLYVTLTPVHVQEMFEQLHLFPLATLWFPLGNRHHVLWWKQLPLIHPSVLTQYVPRLCRFSSSMLSSAIASLSTSCLGCRCLSSSAWIVFLTNGLLDQWSSWPMVILACSPLCKDTPLLWWCWGVHFTKDSKFVKSRSQVLFIKVQNSLLLSQRLSQRMWSKWSKR